MVVIKYHFTKMLDQSNLKAFFADKKIYATEKVKDVVERVENIVSRGENAGEKCLLPAFSSFPTVFSKRLFSTVIKSCDCVVKVFCFTQVTEQQISVHCHKINFIFQLSEYPCNITHGIFFLIYHGYF